MGENSIDSKSINYLQNVLKNRKESQVLILQSVIRAQTELIKLSLNPRVIESCVDVILENLHKAIENSEDEDDRYWVRTQSTLLMQSLLYYLYGIMLKNNVKTVEEGGELIKIAANNIYDLCQVITEVYLASEGIIIPSSESKENIEEIKKLRKEKGFINKTVDFFVNIFKRKKEKDIFLTSLDSVLEKIFRYKDLLGKSIILSELVKNYQNDLVLFRVSNDVNSLNRSIEIRQALKDRELIKESIAQSVLIVPIMIVIAIVDYFFETSYFNSLYVIYWLATPLPIYLFNLIKTKLSINRMTKEIDLNKKKLKKEKTKLNIRFNNLSEELRPDFTNIISKENA